jgi:Uri superfamily endonuclease
MMNRQGGSYVLLIKLSEEGGIAVGALGIITFPQGFYAYVGSAMGGLKSRINYHLREKKHPHWHIDYLLDKAQVIQVISAPTDSRLECTLAQILAKEIDFIPGFGSSDCKCKSHLYFELGENRLKTRVVEAFAELGLGYQLRSFP